MKTKTAKLPIGGHQAKTKRRYALVDAELLGDLKRYRWIFHEGQGYAYRWTVEGGRRKMVYLHRHILGLQAGDGRVADHINGQKLDCRGENLRICTAQQNAQNIRRQGGTSPFRGVFLSGKKWIAVVRQGKNTHYLGRFSDEIEAAKAAEAKRKEVMPYAEPDPVLHDALAQNWQYRIPMKVS